ncbi:hypothetical protein PR048_005033 [Dryococelus australis]|uniref:Uncharacterized protein n=1 Tax=Dryococelus australis TaxID=614101 RepID=A0ABQ9I729_9NEOP|nr:hypothetical protein PR048_005033 [Dryococelus australis]
MLVGSGSNSSRVENSPGEYYGHSPRLFQHNSEGEEPSRSSQQACMSTWSSDLTVWSLSRCGHQVRRQAAVASVTSESEVYGLRALVHTYPNGQVNTMFIQSFSHETGHNSRGATIHASYHVDYTDSKATGETTPVRGNRKAIIKLTDLSIQHNVYIAEIEDGCILGPDALHKLGCCTNTLLGMLQVCSTELVVSTQHDLSSAVSCPVVCCQLTVLPASSEVILTGMSRRICQVSN